MEKETYRKTHHRMLPTTPHIDVTQSSNTNGFARIAIDIQEYDRESTTNQLTISRANKLRRSWAMSASTLFDANRRTKPQFTSFDDRSMTSLSAQSSPIPRTKGAHAETPTQQQNSRQFLTVEQNFRPKSPVMSNAALQRRIQYMQSKQHSMGNRESRTAVDNCDYLFSASFDAGCTSSPHAKDFGNPAALGTSSIPNTTTKSSSSVVSTPSPLRTSNVSPSSNTSTSQKSPSSTTIHNNPSQQRLQPQRDDSINSDESNADNSSSYDKQRSSRTRTTSSSSNASLNMITNRRGTTYTPNSGDMNNQKTTPNRGVRSGSSTSKNSARNSAEKTPSKMSPASSKLPSISSSSQSIIVSCMENARGDIASRIVQRMAHKRDDFSQFVGNLNHDQMADLVSSVKQLLSDVVKNISYPEKIREISIQFGIDQVPRRGWGFKADFFAVMANALATECVFLDGAAHQPTETIEAWAELVEFMFSSVRDGYYQQIRFLRRSSHCFNSAFSCSSDTDTMLESSCSNGTRSSHDVLAPHYKSTGQLNQPESLEPIAAPGTVIRF